ncbi:MAG: TlpA disulfide reductase family protein [Polyangiaceae bacterium]
MPKPTSKSERPAWLVPALVMALAVIVGVVVLPRLGNRMQGAPSPDFSLPVIFGGEPDARVKLSEQRGKLVLLDFWASWCKPCREQARVIAEVTKKHPDVVVLGINVSDSEQAAQRYLAQSAPSWLVLGDPEDTAARAYQVTTLPTLVLVGRDGRVSAVRRHFVSERELTTLLEVLGGS